MLLSLIYNYFDADMKLVTSVFTCMVMVGYWLTVNANPDAAGTQAATQAGSTFKAGQIPFGREYAVIDFDSSLRDYIDAMVAEVDENAFAATPKKFEKLNFRGGYKVFCLGTDYIRADMIAAPWPMTPEEKELCDANEVGEVLEIKLGYDAVIVASDRKGPSIDLDPQVLFKAVAEKLPAAKPGKFRVSDPNRYTNWNQINKDFSDSNILVFTPYDWNRQGQSVKQLVQEQGCRSWPQMIPMRDSQRRSDEYFDICHSARRDGRFVRGDKRNPEPMQLRLKADASAIGFMSWGQWQQDDDGLKVYPVSGVLPSAESIQSGEYPLSRTMYVYIKTSSFNNVKGMRELAKVVISDEVLGEKGLMAEMGLMPLPNKQLAAQTEQLSSSKSLQ